MSWFWYDVISDLFSYSFQSLLSSITFNSNQNQNHRLHHQRLSILNSLSHEQSSLSHTHTFSLKISVIIPSYNEEKTISKVIQYALEDENVEIIVCDGGSKDLTVDIVSELQRNHSQIKCLIG
jgi:cellulose synthase/poly-beta-1,6-N-acetylglucosamine synthase-like glycosyltransferase